MRIMAIALLVLFAGCGRSMQSNGDGIEGDVTLAVTPDSVAPSDSVTLTLTNGSGEAIGYNLCTSAMERQVSGGWEPIRSDRVCTLELRTLDAGAQATYALQIPADLTPGSYRFRAALEMMGAGARDEVASEPFRIVS